MLAEKKHQTSTIDWCTEDAISASDDVMIMTGITGGDNKMIHCDTLW